MRYSYFIIFFILLLALPLITSAPPITTVQQFSEGFVVQVPADNIFKLNQNYTFDFHIANISNGHPITSGISCQLHLYDSQGVHTGIGIDGNVAVGLDYEIFMNEGNFSTIGDSYYYVNCNSSVMGGYQKEPISVTKTGTDKITEGESNVLMIVIISILAIGIFFFILGMKITNPVASLACIIFSGLMVFILVLTTTELLSDVLSGFGSITATYVTVIRIIKWIVSIGITWLLLYIGYKAYGLFKIKIGRAG